MNKQLLTGACASLAALVLMACGNKTETIDAGTPPPVAPATPPAEAPAAPVAESQTGMVKPEEFRAFSSTSSAENTKGTGTPAPGSLQAEAAAFQAQAQKVEKKVVGIPPETLKGPGAAPPPIVLEAPGGQ